MAYDATWISNHQQKDLKTISSVIFKVNARSFDIFGIIGEERFLNMITRILLTTLQFKFNYVPKSVTDNASVMCRKVWKHINFCSGSTHSMDFLEWLTNLYTGHYKQGARCVISDDVQMPRWSKQYILFHPQTEPMLVETRCFFLNETTKMCKQINNNCGIIHLNKTIDFLLNQYPLPVTARQAISPHL